MHGTVYEAHAGLLTRIVDRGGAVCAALQWSATGEPLVRLEVPGVVVDGAVVAHPLLGDAHAIAYAGGETAMTALAWARPTEIPWSRLDSGFIATARIARPTLVRWKTA